MEEKKLGQFFEIVTKDDGSAIALPANMTVSDLREYIQDMIRSSQPRHLRKEGRSSLNIADYDIPQNYFMVESNTVGFHGTMGTVMIDEEDPFAEEEAEPEKNSRSGGHAMTVPNYFRSDDLGAQVCLHIFRMGRRTIDELVADLRSYDPKMLTLLLHRLREDRFLKLFKEEDGVETWELYTREEKKKLDVS